MVFAFLGDSRPTGIDGNTRLVADMGSITRRHRWYRGVTAGAIVALLGAGCTDSGASTTAPTPAATTEFSSPSGVPSPTILPSPCEGAGAADIEDVPDDLLTMDTTYWVDPDDDRSTLLCATLTLPADGWHPFLGVFKDREEDGELVERVSAIITDVTNLTVDACSEQRARDPAVGPSVEDLAAALTALPPFEVASPPVDVTMYGYSGKHLQLRVPEDMPYASAYGTFEGCFEGRLRTWIAPELSFAFYGYTAPGDTEDFWILDVDGTRLVIAALTSAKASEALIAERQSVLDSIALEP